MNSRGYKEWGIRSVILLIGLVIAHFGVTLFLLSDLGSDPFNVFVQGVFGKVGALLPAGVLSHGRTHMTISFFIIAILLLVDKRYIKIGTILCMVFGGPIIDFFSWALGFLIPEYFPLWMRTLMLICGCIILAYGMTIVIKSDAGTGPNDLVAVVLSDKSHKPFSIVRLLVDGCFALVGFLLGGTIGVGTLICIGLVGPVAGFFLPRNERLVQRILDEYVS
ncbi:MAG: hypothetical protein K6G04_07000 [Lachnospiraceae bacterium]|nr:hypothetical protein [Lachnospiraceae bacterium]